MDPEQALATATTHIQAIQTAAEDHHTQLTQLASNRDVSEDYRSRTRTQLQQDFQDGWTTAYRTTAELLDNTAKAADAALATAPSDPGAMARVTGALATMPAYAVADVLLEMGDADGMRALRSQIPMYVAAQVRDPQQRKIGTERMLRAIDEHLAAIGTPAEAAAVRARTGIEATRAQLESATAYARNPSGPRRLNLAFAAGR